MHKKVLLENVDKIHTTETGVGRKRRNLEIGDEPMYKKRKKFES